MQALRGSIADRLAKPFRAEARYYEASGAGHGSFYGFAVPGKAGPVAADVRVYGERYVQVRHLEDREESPRRFRSVGDAESYLAMRYVFGQVELALRLPCEVLDDRRSLEAQVGELQRQLGHTRVELARRQADVAKLWEERTAAVEGGWPRIKELYRTRERRENDRLRSEVARLKATLAGRSIAEPDDPSDHEEGRL